ncbi:hypothetical protein E2562_021527 [Oryza meyeriana var. granulata]|uniref:Uncharacterized protein n=1 Tax=Oryza meyeriana var. granulata TaxID=110450 RepID=A0A6G1E0G5_9ORYZ|nr:hypothetical protein E2562_021527 [Oryza meyeriana var. granulata]
MEIGQYPTSGYSKENLNTYKECFRSLIYELWSVDLSFGSLQLGEPDSRWTTTFEVTLVYTSILKGRYFELYSG